jgi:hypothetical protein
MIDLSNHSYFTLFDYRLRHGHSHMLSITIYRKTFLNDTLAFKSKALPQKDLRTYCTSTRLLYVDFETNIRIHTSVRNTILEKLEVVLTNLEKKDSSTINSQKTIFCLLVALGQPLQSLSDGNDKKTAPMIIDVQDCFMEASCTSSGEDGSLAVQNTAEIVPIIDSIRTEKSCLFDVVLRSQDYHTVNHISFGPTHGLGPFAHLAGFAELPLTRINPDSGSTQDASCCQRTTLRPTTVPPLYVLTRRKP